MTEAQEASLHLAEWLDAGIRHFRLEFVHESAAQVAAITRAFASALSLRSTPDQLSRELRRLAPGGCTEGSLFVPKDYRTLPVLG